MDSIGLSSRWDWQDLLFWLRLQKKFNNRAEQEGTIM